MLHPTRIALLLVAMLVLSARADISLPAGVTPQVDALLARVQRGGQVVIELRGHYGGAGSVTFEIVRPPRQGKLSGLQASGGNRATITYTHVARHPEKLDDFAYVIRAGGRVSSPAEVRIEVNDPPPRLQTIGELDFGEIQAGQSALRELPITNAGGGVLQGRMTVSSPWRIVPADFRVEAGEAKTLQLTFQPNEAKAFVGQVTLSDDRGNTITVALSGIATPALRVLPGTLLFGAEPRRETISLTNLMAVPVELTFETGRHLQPIEGITLAGNDAREVAVEVRPEVVGPIHETMAINGPRFQVAVVLEIPALPAQPALGKAAPVAPPPTSSPTVAGLPVASSPPAAQEITGGTPASEVAPLVAVAARRLEPALWELRWSAGSPRAASYRVEERSLSLNGAGVLQTAWGPLPASIGAGSDPVTAKVGNLDEYRAHVLRVTALDPDGTTRWESPPIALAALPVSSHERTFWLVGLSLALAAFLFLRWRGRVVSA